ncbi:MAG: hypothetical protein ACFB21_03560 [Opitutales bacterium]
MLLAQSGVRDDEAGPTGPAVALAALLCIQNHLDQFTDLSGKMVLGNQDMLRSSELCKCPEVLTATRARRILREGTRAPNRLP